MSLTEQATTVVAELTGRAPEDARQLGGGDTAAAFTVRFADGTTVFAKTAPEHMPGAVPAEAASLTWLANAGSVAVPAVHGSTECWLITDHVEPGSPSADVAEELGRGLARLHAAGASAHGSPPPDGPTEAWIGLAPMRNEPLRDWPAFYAQYRIEPYLRRATDSGALSPDDVEVVSRVCDRIDELAGPPEPPARLHGDLWSGNVHWGRDRAWLVDPAAHGGHRETDLAMLQLFGCPHLERVLAAYQEISPLAEGWTERVGLHQLFPLLVHTVLFGGAFAGQTRAAACSALNLAS